MNAILQYYRSLALLLCIYYSFIDCKGKVSKFLFAQQDQNCTTQIPSRLSASPQMIFIVNLSHHKIPLSQHLLIIYGWIAQRQALYGAILANWRFFNCQNLNGGLQWIHHPLIWSIADQGTSENNQVVTAISILYLLYSPFLLEAIFIGKERHCSQLSLFHWSFVSGRKQKLKTEPMITNDRVRISQVRQRLVSSCQVSVSSCPAQTQEAQYAQKKYSQSCIFKAHIFTS